MSLLLLLPGIALEIAGEWLGRMLGLFPVGEGENLQNQILILNQAGPGLVLLLSLCVCVTLVLLAAASAAFFRSLTVSQPPVG